MIENSEAIARMWDMMNGSKSYEQKCEEINKVFGIGESQIKRFLAISRLSEELKNKIQSPSHRDLERFRIGKVAENEKILNFKPFLYNIWNISIVVTQCSQ